MQSLSNMSQRCWVEYDCQCKTKTTMLLPWTLTTCCFDSIDRSNNHCRPIRWLVEYAAQTLSIPLYPNQTSPMCDTLRQCSMDTCSCVFLLTIPMLNSHSQMLIDEPPLGFANTRPARTMFSPRKRIAGESEGIKQKPHTALSSLSIDTQAHRDRCDGNLFYSIIPCWNYKMKKKNDFIFKLFNFSKKCLRFPKVRMVNNALHLWSIFAGVHKIITEWHSICQNCQTFARLIEISNSWEISVHAEFAG